MMSSVSNNRVLLVPRQLLAYGQDFHNAGLWEHCGLSQLFKRDKKYHWDRDPPELIVTQNPDDAEDANFVARFSGQSAIVAHQHCRWEYFDENQKAAVRKTLANATLKVAPADFLVREMKQLFPGDSWRVASNGVRTDLFYPAKLFERQAFKRTHLIPVDRKLVGFVGRIESAKGIDVLKLLCQSTYQQAFSLFVQFPAWQTIRENREAWDGSEKFVQDMREINPRKVTIWPDESPRLNDRPVRFFDVLASPSLSEVQPLVIIEALLSGVPVVTTESSPFIKILRESLPSHLKKYLVIVPLPDRLRGGATSRKTTLTQSEAIWLADQIVEGINSVNINDLRGREELSAAMLEAGYSEASMNGRLNNIYQECVERFSAGRDENKEGQVYPLAMSYIEHIPERAGVIVFFAGEEMIRTAAVMDPAEGIRGRLLSEMENPRGITHFFFETSENPQTRQRELNEHFEKLRETRLRQR